MNWSGLLFGVSLAVALCGAAGAAFAQQTRVAVYLLAVTMLGVAGTCLALGSDFLAVVVVLLLAGGIPAGLLAAQVVAPVAEPDVRGGTHHPWIATAIMAGFAALAWLLTRAAWVPAGGPRQGEIEWLGSRLLTDHLLTLDLLAALLGLAGLGAVALLRARRAGR